MGMTLVDLLAKIPESAWGVIGGALIALISVVISNRHSRKQQAQQHMFESSERQRERRTNLCRDVYLPAVDAVVELNGKFAKLLDGNQASIQEVASAIQTLGAAVTRLQMVGSAETIKHAAELQRASIKSFFNLQKLIHPMTLRNIDIDIANGIQQRYHDERAKYLQLMKEYNDSGEDDPQRFHRLNEHFNFAHNQCTEAGREHSQLRLAQETARLDMIESCIAIMTDLSRSQIPLLATARGELEAADGPSAALIEKEAKKTADVGAQALRDLVPVMKENLARLRADIEADE